MKVKIVFLYEIFRQMMKGLEWDGREKLLFLLCHSSSYRDQVKLMPYSLMMPGEEDYVSRSSGYVEVKKEYISEVFNTAVELQSDVVQVHPHPPGAGGRFSPVDRHHEPKLMRHVAEHINGIYHASIVFSNDFSELDSWFYDRRKDDLVAVKKVLVVGKDRLNLFIPSGVREGKKKLPPRMDRTVKAFGEDAVRMLGYVDVGVVGLSALGLPIVEMLARDDFGSILGCDPDLIDETNLNRLIGTTPQNIGEFKADFAADMAGKINPDVQVTTFRKSFYEVDVLRAVAQKDILFGCVDSEARFSIDRLANANLIPYFDLGAGILRKNDKVTFKGGQVISIIPGREVCLDCSGMFENLKNEFWSPGKRERERKAGYLMDGDEGQPLVAHLDSVIAGLGYHTMLNYIWGQGPDDNFKLYCDMANNTLMEAASSSDGCMYCRKDGLLGMGDKVSPLVPMEDIDLDIPAAA